MPIPQHVTQSRGAKGILGSFTRSRSHEKSGRLSSDDEEPRRISASMEVLRHLGKDKKKSASFEDIRLKRGRLSIVIESPPLVSYGKPEHSTGALMSGQLKMILTDRLKLESFTLEFVARIRYLKPVHKDCQECAVGETELRKWTMITGPRTFDKGEHSTPFSFLLPGHLPATTHCSLANIEYLLKAIATTDTQERMTTYHTLEVKRALMPPELPRQATRVFPPTTVKAEIIYPLVVHPTGVFNVQLELTGIIGMMPSAPGGDLMRRWRLRKLIWLVEEHAKVVSPACAKHGTKVGGIGKGIEHESERTIGEGEIKDGWKLDWNSGENGTCAIEIPCLVNTGRKPSCDVRDSTGLEVKHRVMLEMIIFEEIAANKKMTQWNNTGSARVLRFSFQILITERAGEGVSWDEETPPMYEDVPRSPPGYKYERLTACESRDIPDIIALSLTDAEEDEEEAPRYE
ncbi:MAG: hypothetical protein GOMPHAMPRED_004688 [Gomphillus americanus]|uniref:LDB19 N-terminal domain-containing protein n=1 Tax=Gomphillus americanus TaxID=1940652 RepID=A0A8H3I686_9LECA|nr:MAG: hypothetical protein GOMPHAMPRED_004688 [Gomphillus americanus]